jgi:hypothetical protein
LKIAKWDGSTWSAISTGLGGSAYRIAIDKSNNLPTNESFIKIDKISVYFDILLILLYI